MAERKKMSDAALKFIQTGEVESSPENSEIETTPIAEIKNPKSKNTTPSKKVNLDLRRQFLGETKESEATIRFTVDLPKSLHRRLEQLSLDSSKPKTELVRTMILQTLDQIGY